MTLADFREMGGSITSTRYAELHVWHQDKATWRILATDETNDTNVTGPPYRTRFEALSALPEVATLWGMSA